MSLRTRLIAPVTAVLTGGLALGMLTLAPTPAVAAVPAPVTHTKADQTPTETVFKRSSYLCYGYQDCKDAGMGSAGYAQGERQDVLADVLRSQLHQLRRLPDGQQWPPQRAAVARAAAMRPTGARRCPRSPMMYPDVGAVAWWKANTGPAGSAGHVAYVEQVVSPDEVIVSQDSWNGDFSWATITRSSGNWPSGFIHFNDQTLVNKTAPVVDGIAKVGAQLTATPGTWKPTDANVSYQWQADGQPIANGTGASFKIGGKRIGQVLTVTTTATKLGYPTRSATSAPTAVVLPGELSNAVAPTLGGVTQVDSTLTVDTGTWDPVPDSLSVQWYADGVAIDGAIDSHLALGPELVGRVITATVTAQRDNYDSVTVTSAASEQVAPGVFKVEHEPSISGTPRLGETLTLDEGVFRPSDDNVQVVGWGRATASRSSTLLVRRTPSPRSTSATRCPPRSPCRGPATSRRP